MFLSAKRFSHTLLISAELSIVTRSCCSNSTRAIKNIYIGEHLFFCVFRFRGLSHALTSKTFSQISITMKDRRFYRRVLRLRLSHEILVLQRTMTFIKTNYSKHRSILLPRTVPVSFLSYWQLRFQKMHFNDVLLER